MKSTVGSGSTVFLHADDEEIGEYSAAGALQLRYIPGPEIDRPIGWVNSAGTKRFFHADRRGSIIAVTNTSAAATEGPYSYDAYGKPSAATGTPIKYTGRRYDPETGLYYYRARYYSPTLGRFMQTDPVGYEAGLNLYEYVQDDPIGHADPMGLCIGNKGENCPTNPGQMAKQLLKAAGKFVQQHPKATAVAAMTVAAVAIETALSGGTAAAGPDEATLVAGGTRAATVAAEEDAAAAATQGPRFARGSLRNQVLQKGRQPDGSVQCAYCKKPTSTPQSDHIVSYKKGGPTNLENLNPSCPSCNASKGSKDLGTEWTPPSERQ